MKVEEDVCHPSPFLSWFMRKPLDIISAVMTIMNSVLLYMVLEYEGYKTRVGMGLEVGESRKGAVEKVIATKILSQGILAFAFLFGAPPSKSADRCQGPLCWNPLFLSRNLTAGGGSWPGSWRWPDRKLKIHGRGSI